MNEQLIKAQKERIEQQAARIAALEADKAKLIDTLNAFLNVADDYKKENMDNRAMGITAQEARRVLAEVKNA